MKKVLIIGIALVFGFADGFKAIDRKLIADVIQSRKKGGIFSGPTSPPKKATPPELAARKVVANFEKRVRSLEKKMALSIEMTAKLEARLNDWTRHDSKRDDIISGLLEILRENLSLRRKMVSKNIQMKKGRATEEGKSAHLISLKGKKE